VFLSCHFCRASVNLALSQVWALAISADDRTIISGAADSVITFWEDSTEAEAAEKESRRAEMVIK
jgi:U3 small nucleolar RNA-associated protein 13